MTSIKCAYVVWLSLQIMFCGFHLAIFSLIFLSRFYSFIVFSQLSFDCLFAYDVLLFSRICCVTSLYAELEQSPHQLVGGRLKRTNLTSGPSLISSQQTTNTHKKRRWKGEINKDNTKIGGILNRRFWQLGQAWFPLTLKTREQKKRTKITNRDNIRKE